MECTVPSALVSAATVAPLLHALAEVPDQRRLASIQYRLASVLALVVLGLLAGQRSVLAIAEWAAQQPSTVLAPLGLVAGHTPCQSTVQRILTRVDAATLSQVLTTDWQPLVAADPTVRGRQAVAVDGKAYRGARCGAPAAVVQVVSACCGEVGVVLVQEAVPHPDPKAEAELMVVPRLLARVTWSGRILTRDVLSCQRRRCQQILETGGDYLLVVKQHQPVLYRDLALLFAPPPTDQPLPLLDCRHTSTTDRGHGRTGRLD